MNRLTYTCVCGQRFSAEPGNYNCPACGLSVTHRLTARELEVARLIVNGYTIKTAAARLGVGLRTVDAVKTSIYRKLGVHSIQQFTRKLLDLGLAKPKDVGIV